MPVIIIIITNKVNDITNDINISFHGKDISLNFEFKYIFSSLDSYEKNYLALYIETTKNDQFGFCSLMRMFSLQFNIQYLDKYGI